MLPGDDQAQYLSVQVREGKMMSSPLVKPILTSEVTGAWLEGYDPGERKFIKIGYLLLENGQTLSDITIAYQTWGTLNAAGDNAILIQHAMTGWSDVPGWWPNMVGPGLAFDTDKYFVICPNVIGGCQGSTGPSSIAPDGKRYGSRFQQSRSVTWLQQRSPLAIPSELKNISWQWAHLWEECARWNGR